MFNLRIAPKERQNVAMDVNPWDCVVSA